LVAVNRVNDPMPSVIHYCRPPFSAFFAFGLPLSPTFFTSSHIAPLLYKNGGSDALSLRNWAGKWMDMAVGVGEMGGVRDFAPPEKVGLLWRKAHVCGVKWKVFHKRWLKVAESGRK
jgi:hypothetical protein